MNKAGLIEKIAQDSNIPRTKAETIIDNLVKTIINKLKKGEKVSIVGFGSFEARTRHARGGINPQNPKERITIPEVRVAKFRTGKTLRDALKNSTPKKTAPAEE